MYDFLCVCAYLIMRPPFPQSLHYLHVYDKDQTIDMIYFDSYSRKECG